MLLRQNVQECCESPKVEDYINAGVLDYSTFKMNKQRKAWGKRIQTSWYIYAHMHPKKYNLFSFLERE